MQTSQLLQHFKDAGKRFHMVGNMEAGVVLALDMEGRLFTSLNGEILNRVNPAAILGQSTREQYLNPGGDGLWPAPEGTSLGYQYSTGSWRVPPGLTSARYLVDAVSDCRASCMAELDLVNNKGLGIPVIFKRDVTVGSGPDEVRLTVEESITYMGTHTLAASDCLLVPWTLCQFDCGPGCKVVFPCQNDACVWDLYDDSSHFRHLDDATMTTITDGSGRYQIGIGDEVPWIEYHDPRRNLSVRREAAALTRGHAFIDIRDVAPDIPPQDKGVRYSVYSDPSGFMEIEAAGGCPDVLTPGTTLSLIVSTRISTASLVT